MAQMTTMATPQVGGRLGLAAAAVLALPAKQALNSHPCAGRACLPALVMQGRCGACCLRWPPHPRPQHQTRRQAEGWPARSPPPGLKSRSSRRLVGRVAAPWRQPLGWNSCMCSCPHAMQCSDHCAEDFFFIIGWAAVSMVWCLLRPQALLLVGRRRRGQTWLRSERARTPCGAAGVATAPSHRRRPSSCTR